MKNPSGVGVAILVPCYNEAKTIGTVVRDFRRALPKAEILVFDNRSTDASAAEASAAGAVVRKVSQRGKGNVVRRMFADVEAEVYLMVDGDGTYDAAAAGALVQRLRDGGLDMVVGTRVDGHEDAYRPGHRIGNVMLTRTVAFLFGDTFSDMLSGYRVLSRRYAKSFPAAATGFEIETELTVHALQLHMPVAEMPTRYGTRPEGSVSKLSTWRDGWRILYTIGRLFKNERPLMFFSLGFAACSVASFVLAVPLFDEYLRTGLVPRFPTAILCTGLMLLGMILLACGLILDTVTHGRIEAKRLAYLAVSGPSRS
ncbi:MAG TPA: glycosyltransferase [Gammaproteobacteria bacterium]|jgi:glycosyltransferase involved in cell wall biosynthesis